MIQNVTVTNFARTEAASVLNLTYNLTIWSYNGAISTLQPLSTSRSNEDLKLLDGLTPQTRCICDKRMEILNCRDQMRGLTPNILPHSPHIEPNSRRLETQTWPFGQQTCRQKHPRLNMTRSCANLYKRPPLRTASVDQGYANRDVFPSSLSLEPNGHVGASCHCHPLSIRSGLAPSSQLLRPNRYRGLAALRYSEGTGPFASHPANGVQNVQVFVCSDALWVRRASMKTTQVRRHLCGAV